MGVVRKKWVLKGEEKVNPLGLFTNRLCDLDNENFHCFKEEEEEAGLPGKAEVQKAYLVIEAR